LRARTVLAEELGGPNVQIRSRSHRPGRDELGMTEGTSQQRLEVLGLARQDHPHLIDCEDRLSRTARVDDARLLAESATSYPTGTKRRPSWVGGLRLHHGVRIRDRFQGQGLCPPLRAGTPLVRQKSTCRHGCLTVKCWQPLLARRGRERCPSRVGLLRLSRLVSASGENGGKTRSGSASTGPSHPSAPSTSRAPLHWRPTLNVLTPGIMGFPCFTSRSTVKAGYASAGGGA
jgi:hypothetical protein